MAVIVKHKSTVFGLVGDLSKIQNSSGFDANLNYVSVPTANYISTATSVKHATELLDSKVKDSADTIAANKTELDGKISTINTDMGTVANLSTVAKTVVGAINEHDAEIGDIATVSIADGSAADIAGLINVLENVKLNKSANLSDVANVTTARANLSVNSIAEVDQKILEAKLALGTNFNAATIAERDAMINLDAADRVFVADDGDTKWALYKVGAVDANGTGTSWIKIMDQDSLENSISKESIKAAYELNPDTNAYTDAEQTKVGFVSVTAAIDLDKVIQNDELNTSAVLNGASNTDIASSLAVKTYVDNEAAKLLEINNNLSDVADVAVARTNLDVYSKGETTEAIRLGGAVFRSENVTVAADKVTLSFEPKNGMLFNFATVRHVDNDGVSWDIPTTPTADAKVFNIHPDVAGQFDGKSVMVQYSHVA